MAGKSNILILGPDAQELQNLAHDLSAQDISAVCAAGPREAIGALRGGAVDLIVVHAANQRPPAAEFLAKARELLPAIPRAVYEPSPSDIDLRQLINQAAPLAIFTTSIDPKRIQALIEESARSKKAGAENAAAAAEIKQLKARVTDLKRQLSLSAKATPAGDLQGKKPAAPSKPSSAKPMDAANLLGGGFSLAGTQTEKSAEQAATKQAISASPSQEPSPAALPAGGALEFDLLTDDTPAELVRMMGLMLEEPDLRLPVLPRIGNEVSRLMADDNTSFEQLASVVGLEPSMSARILEVANSPMYGGKEQIRSVQSAVSRVGMSETRNILQAVAGENLFKTKDKRYAEIMAKLWMHSLAVAYSNEILARALFIAESDDFFMMGLLHDIGKLLMLHLAQLGMERKLWSKNQASPENLMEAFNRFHNALGQKLMEKWEYPESFHAVVQLHNDDARVHEYEEPVVVTYYSNLLTRKLGFSLREHSEALINNHQIAQALNMSDDARNQIEANLRQTLAKLRESYL